MRDKLADRGGGNATRNFTGAVAPGGVKLIVFPLNHGRDGYEVRRILSAPGGPLGRCSAVDECPKRHAPFIPAIKAP